MKIGLKFLQFRTVTLLHCIGFWVGCSLCLPACESKSMLSGDASTLHPEESSSIMDVRYPSTGLQRLMTRMENIRAGLMIAGNHSPIDAVMKEQLEFTKQMLMESGLSSEQVEGHPGVQSLAQINVQLAKLRAGEHGGSPIGGVPIVFWQSYFEQNKRVLREAVELFRPLLLMRGTYDWNLSHDEWLAWQKTLASSPCAQIHHRVELPGITHALNRVTQPDWKKIRPEDIGSTIDSSVIDTIAAFCNQYR